MMSADDDGSDAAFFTAVVPLAGGGGVVDALPFAAPSVCALFFLRAMSYRAVKRIAN
jgi:hypothetical protein